MATNSAWGAVTAASPNDEIEAAALALCAQLAAGERQALAGLYDLLGAALYGMALCHTKSRDDASDVVQDVFLRLAERPRLLERARHPRAYLLRMTQRAAREASRRRRGRRETGLDPVLLVEGRGGRADRRADAARASELLARLPIRQREAVYLRQILGLTFAGIGEATGVPTFTAASRYRLGLRRLRRWMRIES